MAHDPLRLGDWLSYNTFLRLEVPMPYVFRPHRRFPIFSPVRYQIQHREGYGTITNLSRNGWRLHGNLPARQGDVCSLKVRLAARKWISVAAGKVRWVRGDQCGIETLVMNTESEKALNAYLQERIKAL